MKTNREKFLALVSNEDTKTAEKNRERIAKRAMLRASGDIAFKVLERLDELGWSQKQLAEAMGVSPQYVSKMVKGQENFTLETQVKLQAILDIPILAIYYENNKEHAKLLFRGEAVVEARTYTQNERMDVFQSFTGVLKTGSGSHHQYCA